MSVLGRISEIWRYPVSSMGGETIEATELTLGGVPGDRIWGVESIEKNEVAGPERRKYWRGLPSLFSRLKAGVPEVGNRDAGDWYDVRSHEASDLLSSWLEMPVRLRPHAKFGTEVEGHVAPRYQRADLHVLTTASLRALASGLDDPAQAVSPRFRPNVLIETTPEHQGFAEHALIGKTLAIGEARIEIHEPCSRCAFTVLAQQGLSFEPKILRHIVQKGSGGFGVLCKVTHPGGIALGSEVRVIEA
ncbi:MOSC domain containing protein [Nitratireductor aquibiodomus RA22]|uniref:MOSC domain containing protein n=1 Tax=Nitratireductor aquibiodomus RA22 TaxID=1189611 RepID=I5BVE2_9HYPH|nr:MOSC domain-containing protein [Nitratireductor aquibiodomus]EIM73544.1 MOSC domain containing protein [Nitratireductor aquibiodomus RA22]